ncbi:MAG TPA: ferritin family protein [Bacteroidales bacterium]|nr:ferritin family protein [Bacteroidales bacterium]HSA44211.1 ferritin family protein [Bacteroidales bacterium]
MNEITGTDAENALAEIFFLKSQIILQYVYFAKQARKDGYEQMAAIFEETSEQCRSHAKTLLRLLEESTSRVDLAYRIPALGDTATNLSQSIELETRLMTLMKTAENMCLAEGFKRAATKLKLFSQISSFYIRRFTTLLENIREGRVFIKEQKVKWICRKCGLIYESERALHNCPGCEHPQAWFEVLAENW